MLEKGGRLSKLPEVDLCFTELYELLVAPLKENLMLAGIEIGVFDRCFNFGCLFVTFSSLSANSIKVLVGEDGFEPS